MVNISCLSDDSTINICQGVLKSNHLLILIYRQGFSLDFHFSIFPFWGMRKMNQFPLAEKDFPTNFQKITIMGIEI